MFFSLLHFSVKNFSLCKYIYLFFNKRLVNRGLISVVSVLFSHALACVPMAWMSWLWHLPVGPSQLCSLCVPQAPPQGRDSLLPCSWTVGRDSSHWRDSKTVAFTAPAGDSCAGLPREQCGQGAASQFQRCPGSVQDLARHGKPVASRVPSPWLLPVSPRLSCWVHRGQVAKPRSTLSLPQAA